MERRSWLVLALVTAGGLAACEPPRDRDRPEGLDEERGTQDVQPTSPGVQPTSPGVQPTSPGVEPTAPATPEEEGEPAPGGTPYRNP